MWRQTTIFKPRAVALACAALLAACGGGGGSGGADGGMVQAVEFAYPGGGAVGVPPAVATTRLVATATGGGPITFSSNTPDTCSVNGDQLSLLKAGECSVTATQPGGNGYAAASQKQLFVIAKNQQKVVRFQNPGWQPLDTNPVPLSATFDSGLPVTLSSKTPTVCTVSGTTLTKLANGMCTVTAEQAGNDIYAPTKVDRNIPIGTEKPAALNFLTGYKDNDSTKEGLIGHVGNQWWCNDCDRSVSGGGSSYTFTASFDTPPDATKTSHASFQLFGPGLVDSDLYNLGNDVYRAGVKAPVATGKGVQVDIQTALHFNLAQNPEWFGAANNKINVELFTNHFNSTRLDANGHACTVTLKATVQPTAAAATDYSVGLKDQFSIGETCGLSGLDAWNELQGYPVIEIKFSAVQPNGQMANAASKYQTRFKLTGPIYFQ
jgi:hypothetical protein